MAHFSEFNIRENEFEVFVNRLKVNKREKLDIEEFREAFKGIVSNQKSQNPTEII